LLEEAISTAFVVASLNYCCIYTCKFDKHFAFAWDFALTSILLEGAISTAFVVASLNYCCIYTCRFDNIWRG